MEIEVIRSCRKTLSVEIREGHLLVRAPLRVSGAEITRFLQEKQGWIDKHMARAQAQEEAKKDILPLTEQEIRSLAKEAKRLIPDRAAYFARLMGVSYGRITIRCQRTRWGSCSSKGNLNFNCLLMLAPPEVLDSVVVHELCHRKELNHSDRFYAHVLRVFPDYWRWNRWLKDNGDSLLSLLES